MAALHGQDNGRFVIGVDYGTTYSGISWAFTAEPNVAIHTLMTWPHSTLGGTTEGVVHVEGKVPSEFTCSSLTGSSWGYGVGKSKYVIVRTKLDLQPRTRSKALQVLSRSLREIPEFDRYRTPDYARDMNLEEEGEEEEEEEERDMPFHIIMKPEDVLQTYMTEVAKCVRIDIVKEKGPESLCHPIELVITHPARWPESAIGLTVKAITSAFKTAFIDDRVSFENVILATEPHACAQVTMRDALTAQTATPATLQRGETFIVVDAGGGTVDVITCRVESLNPFKIVEVISPASGPYGSTCVDTYFLNTFLKERLVDRNNLGNGSRRRDHGQGANVVLRRTEKDLLDKFIRIKHKFKGPATNSEGSTAGGEEVDYLELPREISTDEAQGIRNGNLEISCEDMMKMFHDPIEGTRRLIEGQFGQARTTGVRRPQALFLSGGFANNEYLENEVRKLATRRGMKLFKANDTSTAVSRGAVFIGLGLTCEKPPPVARAPFHVGVVLAKRYDAFTDDDDQYYQDGFEDPEVAHRTKNHINWIVFKGDLLGHGSDHGPGQQPVIRKVVPITRRITRNGNKTGTITVLTSTTDQEEVDLPRRFDRRDATHDGPTAQLEYNLTAALRTFDIEPSYRWPSPDPERVPPFSRIQMDLVIDVTPIQTHCNLIIRSDQEDLLGELQPRIAQFSLSKDSLQL